MTKETVKKGRNEKENLQNKKMRKIRHMSKKIDIIKLYLGGYNKSMSGREIAKKASMNHLIFGDLSKVVDIFWRWHKR